MATLVYDGYCGVCSDLARWARARLPENIAVVPYQRADLTALGLSEGEAAEALWWVEDGRRLRGHLAVAGALRAMGEPWALLGGLVDAPLLTGISGALYGLAARNRHRLPGGTPDCEMPPGETGSGHLEQSEDPGGMGT